MVLMFFTSQHPSARTGHDPIRKQIEKELEDEAWDAVIQMAVAEGLLEDTGRRRNGQIVWRCFMSSSVLTSTSCCGHKCPVPRDRIIRLTSSSTR
jgi:hypothetical protein